jgi:hypothetical protein
MYPGKTPPGRGTVGSPSLRDTAVRLGLSPNRTRETNLQTSRRPTPAWVIAQLRRRLQT